MKKITALRVGKGRLKRLNIYLDGKFIFSEFQEEEAESGQALPENCERCRHAALRLLDYRPRSEFELRMRLRQRGYSGNDIEVVVTRLKEQKLIDDIAFARFWKDNRESFSPRSRRLTRLELKQKGISDDISEKVVNTIEDDDSAYRAAAGKADRMSHTEYEDFRRKLGGYLKRRGFSYGVISRTVERIWQEH